MITAATSPAFKKTLSLGIIGCTRTLVVTNDKSYISTQADLKNKKIGFVSGGFLFRTYGNKFGIEAIQTGSSESMFRMLLRYRVDGIFISDIVYGSYRTEGAPFTQIPGDWPKRIGTLVEADKNYVHLRMPISSDFKNLADKLRRAIDIGNENGQFEKIFRKYGSATGGRC